jgi:hypothetical protein
MRSLGADASRKAAEGVARVLEATMPCMSSQIDRSTLVIRK